MDERRAATRYLATFRVRLGYPDMDAFLSGYAVNISKGGIYVPTKQPKPKGTEIRFEILLKDGTTAVSGTGRVAWSRPFDPSNAGARYGMGVEFANVDTASDDIVRKALDWRTTHLPPDEARREVFGDETGLTDVARAAAPEPPAAKALERAPEPPAAEPAAPEPAKPAPEPARPAAGPPKSSPAKRVSLSTVDEMLASLRPGRPAKSAPARKSEPARPVEAESQRRRPEPETAKAEAAIKLPVPGPDAEPLPKPAPEPRPVPRPSSPRIVEPIAVDTSSASAGRDDITSALRGVRVSGVLGPPTDIVHGAAIGRPLAASNVVEPIPLAGESLPSQAEVDSLLTSLDSEEPEAAPRSDAAAPDEEAATPDDDADLAPDSLDEEPPSPLREQTTDPTFGREDHGDELDLPGWDEQDGELVLPPTATDDAADAAPVAESEPVLEMNDDDVDLDQILRETVGAGPAAAAARPGTADDAAPEASSGSLFAPIPEGVDAVPGVAPSDGGSIFDEPGDDGPTAESPPPASDEAMPLALSGIGGATSEEIASSSTGPSESPLPGPALGDGPAVSSSADEAPASLADLPPPPDIAAPLPASATQPREKKGLFKKLFGKKR